MSNSSAYRSEEYDWIFDFVLQFLESEKFDASVMDFVDEKCFVFVDEEENKFIYSEIHEEFCEHIESLITSNLNELGITSELFVESCKKAKDGRDINTTVFERLTAMDDFQTFKKIMTKRNTELQLESIRSFKDGSSASKASPLDLTFYHRGEGKDIDFDYLLSPDEMKATVEEDDIDDLDYIDDEEVQDMLMQSLMSMEFIHRQEELEHAELERALMLSLAIEEERLRLLIADAKIEAAMSDFDSESEQSHLRITAVAADSKLVGSEDSKAFHDTTHAEKASSKAESTTSSKRSTAEIADQLEQPSSNVSTSEPKPFQRLPLRPLTMKPLPSIGGSAPLPAIGYTPLAALDEKKKQTEEVLRRTQDQLTAHRKQEEQLREQIISSVDPIEVERRARHMKEQRELLLGKKKAEREEKVRLEEERRSKKHAADQEMLAESLERINAERFRDSKSEAKSSPGDESTEARRASLRNALARRMKMDLLDNEEAKLSQLQDTQFAELDRRLQQVEQLREDNRRREYILSKQMERQQAQIARNIRISAQELSRDKDTGN